MTRMDTIAAIAGHVLFCIAMLALVVGIFGTIALAVWFAWHGEFGKLVACVLVHLALSGIARVLPRELK